MKPTRDNFIRESRGYIVAFQIITRIPLVTVTGIHTIPLSFLLLKVFQGVSRSKNEQQGSLQIVGGMERDCGKVNEFNTNNIKKEKLNTFIRKRFERFHQLYFNNRISIQISLPIILITRKTTTTTDKYHETNSTLV